MQKSNFHKNCNRLNKKLIFKLFNFSYAHSVGAVHFHTSAKMNSGIEEIFLSLCRMMIEKADKQSADNLVTLNRSGSTRRTIVIDDEDAPPLEQSRWCCSS